MGMIAYFYRSHYVKNCEHIPEEQLYRVFVVKGGELVSDIVPSRIAYVTEELGKWYGETIIHDLFLKNCLEEGSPEQHLYIPISGLQNILREIISILESDEKPNQDVLSDLKSLRTTLLWILHNEEDSADYYYTYSW